MNVKYWGSHISPARCAATIIACTFILLARPANAQELRLAVSPPIIEAAMKPGASIVIAYTVTNLGDPMVVSTNVRPFVPVGIFGDLVIKDELEGPARFNLENSNLALGQPFLLQSREGQQVLLKIRIPEGTPEGDYYYTFYVKNDLGKLSEGVDAAHAQALVGTNLLLTVTESGSVDVVGSIGKLEVAPRWRIPLFGNEIFLFESTDVIPVQLTVQNTGRHLVKPHGTITLSGGLGERAEYDILPQNVLSQSSRMVNASPSATLAPDAFKHLPKASMYLSGFFVGAYTLRADVDFGLPEQAQSAEVIWYAFPFKLMAAFALVTVLSIFVLKKLRKGEAA